MTAIAMPTMPNRFPRRAVDGCDSPLSARMKHTDATRYHSATWFAVTGLPSAFRIARTTWCSRLRCRLRGRLPALEHLEHALRDEEAAEDIHRRERHGDDAYPSAPVEGDRTRSEHRTDEDDAGDRVGDGHERRVESGRDAPADVVADEHGQHENYEIENDWVDARGHCLLQFSPSVRCGCRCSGPQAHWTVSAVNVCCLVYCSSRRPSTHWHLEHSLPTSNPLFHVELIVLRRANAGGPARRRIAPSARSTLAGLVSCSSRRRSTRLRAVAMRLCQVGINTVSLIPDF